MEWTEKYRPTHLDEIIGNSAAVRYILDWARGWTVRSRPLLLYGKSGVGKTTTALALARELKWDLIELNSSDQRTSNLISHVVGRGSRSATLSGAERRLIVLDEIDNLHGSADRGGVAAIRESIKHSVHPLILIANDLYGVSPEIRNLCDLVQFKALPTKSIAPRIRYICAVEKIGCTEAAIRKISDSASGDLRSAVNILFAAAIGRDQIDEADIQTDLKDKRTTLFSLVSAIFSETSDRDLIKFSGEVDETPETLLFWIEANLPPDPTILRKAYPSLSRADEFLGYTQRRQYYSFWKYASVLILIGIADAVSGRKMITRITPPLRWKNLTTAKRENTLRIALDLKLSARLHLSSVRLREKYLREISTLITHHPDRYSQTLDLDTDQLTFFVKDRKRAEEIVKGRDMHTEPKKRAQQKGAKDEERSSPDDPKNSLNQSTLFEVF